jgi:hypothetical protein
MTAHEFMTLCLERLIDPALALENDAVFAALMAKDYDALKSALDNEF